jgi:hypothetical protein
VQLTRLQGGTWRLSAATRFGANSDLTKQVFVFEIMNINFIAFLLYYSGRFSKMPVLHAQKFTQRLNPAFPMAMLEVSEVVFHFLWSQFPESWTLSAFDTFVAK